MVPGSGVAAGGGLAAEEFGENAAGLFEEMVCGFGAEDLSCGSGDVDQACDALELFGDVELAESMKACGSLLA